MGERAEDIVRLGLELLALEEGAASGDVPTVGAGGSVRYQAGGGASFPPEWTVGADGSLAIDTGVDVVQLTINGSANSNENTVEIVGDAGDPEIVFSTWDDQAFLGLGGGPTPQVSLSSLSGSSDEAFIQVANVASGADARSVKFTAEATTNMAVFDSGGATALRVSTGGYLVVALNAAPADGALSAGECAVWFDSSNGAAKFMFKAKQADGTVKTGSVNVQT